MTATQPDLEKVRPERKQEKGSKTQISWKISWTSVGYVKQLGEQSKNSKCQSTIALLIRKLTFDQGLQLICSLSFPEQHCYSDPDL